jgi:hypothetical protein
VISTTPREGIPVGALLKLALELISPHRELLPCRAAVRQPAAGSWPAGPARPGPRAVGPAAQDPLLSGTDRRGRGGRWQPLTLLPHPHNAESDNTYGIHDQAGRCAERRTTLLPSLPRRRKGGRGGHDPHRPLRADHLGSSRALHPIGSARAFLVGCVRGRQHPADLSPRERPGRRRGDCLQERRQPRLLSGRGRRQAVAEAGSRIGKGIRVQRLFPARVMMTHWFGSSCVCRVAGHHPWVLRSFNDTVASTAVHDDRRGLPGGW